MNSAQTSKSFRQPWPPAKASRQGSPSLSRGSNDNDGRTAQAVWPNIVAGKEWSNDLASGLFQEKKDVAGSTHSHRLSSL